MLQKPQDSAPLPVTAKPNWSKLGLGTGTLASIGRAASLSDVKKILVSMLEYQIAVIDTADSYGSGDSEIIIGRALKGRRNSFTLVTKAGYRLSNLPGPLRPLNQFIKKGIHCFDGRQRFIPSYLASCLDDSLSRLNTDHVEAFLLHDPPLDVVTSDAVLSICVKIRESGKAMLVGISSDNLETLRAAALSGVFGVIQTPANLGVAGAMRPLWQECETNGIHVIGNHVYSPACFEYPGMTHERMMRACAALLPARSTVLCGTRNSAHLVSTGQWANEPMPLEEAAQLAAQLGNS